MLRRRVRTDERGSSLVIAMLMIFVTTAFAGILLGLPSAHLNRVASASAKERAKEAADAGVRDATLFLYANRTNTAILTASADAGSFPVTDLSALPAGSFYPASGSTAAPGHTVVIPSATTHAGLGTSTKAAPLQFGVAYMKGSFGPGTEYYYKIIRRSTNPIYYEVVSVGTALGGAQTKKTTTTVKVYLYREVPNAAIPAAATFLNPNNVNMTNAGGANVNTIFNTQSGGNPPSIVGTDAAGGAPVAGVAIEQPSYGYGSGSATVSGNPAFVGGTYGNPPPQTTWDSLQSIVQNLSQLPPGTAGTQQIINTTYPNGIPVSTGGSNGFQEGIIYIKVPAGSTVNQDLIIINGNNPIRGVIVVDIEPGVTLTTSPIYQKNGTSFFQGAFIVNQQGSLTVPNAGLKFLDKNGNNANFLQFNSVAVQNALTAASPIYRFASYVVQ